MTPQHKPNIGLMARVPIQGPAAANIDQRKPNNHKVVVVRIYLHAVITPVTKSILNYGKYFN